MFSEITLAKKRKIIKGETKNEEDAKNDINIPNYDKNKCAKINQSRWT